MKIYDFEVGGQILIISSILIFIIGASTEI